MQTWNWRTLLVVLLFSTPLAHAAPTTRPTTDATQPATLVKGDQVRTLEVDGLARTYLVHVPPAWDAAKPTPVVLVFHGAFMNGKLMAGFCGLNAKADSAHFVAVYPDGLGFQQQRMLFFNAWSKPGPNGRPPDDVKFTSLIIDDLQRAMNVDPKRVFATGLSNGGMMCYRLAAELSDRIAAVAPVSGTLAMPPDPHPTRPVPVLHFHGTADTIVPWAGSGPRKFQAARFEGVDETIRAWVKLDGCPDAPATTRLPDTAHDGTTLTRQCYGPGKDGSEVILYRIEGGGHTWPGRPAPVAFLGATTMNLQANDVIWDFFEKHPIR